jgi:hypothetical protein
MANPAPKQALRESDGRFAPGNSFGGKKPGARTLFTEDFHHDFRDMWEKYGRDALEGMAKDSPTDFVKAAVALIPKNHTVDLAAPEGVVISFIGFDEHDTVTGDDGHVYRVIDGVATEIGDYDYTENFLEADFDDAPHDP